MRAVNPVDGDVIVSCFADSVADGLGILSVELFPRVSPAVAGVDIACILVNKEYPHMAVAIVASTSKDSVVVFEENQVVESEFSIVKFNHSAPPVNVVIRATTGVISPEVLGLLAALINNKAANTKSATVVRTGSWVNNICSPDNLPIVQKYPPSIVAEVVMEA